MIQDVKGVVATLRLTIMEKNADEMIQDLMWKLTDAGSSLNTPGNADRLVVNANETAPGERDQGLTFNFSFIYLSTDSCCSREAPPHSLNPSRHEQ